MMKKSMALGTSLIVDEMCLLRQIQELETKAPLATYSAIESSGNH